MDHPSSDCARQGIEDFIASHASIALDHIRIDTDPATTTQGPITDPEGRLAPARLAPWKDGYDILGDVFNCLLASLGSHAEGDHPATFPSRLYVDEMGQALSVINSEAAVHLFDVDTIYKPAKKILDAALRRPFALRASMSPILRRRGYRTDLADTNGQDIKGEIVFSPHSRTITVPAHIAGHKRKRPDDDDDDDGAEGVEEGVEEEIHVAADSTNLGQASNRIQRVVRINSVRPLSYMVGGRQNAHSVQENNIKLKSGPGDYYCSFVSNTTSRSSRPKRLLLIGEAKAPHKLTRELIHSALGANTIIDTTQFIQSIEQDYNDYNEGQKWLAAVATQIYTTLLKNKQRYGYITTGESYILLRIPASSPTTIEYLSLPALSSQPAREEDARWLDWLAATPLARLSCLALLSMFSDGELTQAECDQATAAESTLVWRDARVREQSLEPSFQSLASAVTKSSGDQEWTEQHEQNTRKRARSQEEPSGGISKRPRLLMPSKMESEMSTASHHLTPPPEAEHASNPIRRNIDATPFCTSRCILSLTDRDRATPTDPLCPNWAIHQLLANPQPDLSLLARSSVRLPRYNYDDDTEEPPVLCQRVTENAMYGGQYGSTSALFKIRIEPGGYVLVAKAARLWDMVEKLKYEEGVYKRLSALQGDVIPVCAGIVDLSHDLPKPDSCFGREFPAYLLLSWGGSSLVLGTDLGLEQLKTHVDAVLRRVHGLGVLHCDAHPRNILLHNIGGAALGASLVDFERAITKGRFARRASRAHGHAPIPHDKVELDFQHACERERERCLGRLETWDRHRKRQDEQARRRERDAQRKTELASCVPRE